MFKRLFWIGVGVTVGALAVIKAQAYVKANTPDAARAPCLRSPKCSGVNVASIRRDCGSRSDLDRFPPRDVGALVASRDRCLQFRSSNY